MAQPRDLPELNAASLMPLMGPMALPFLMSHNMATAFAQMSQYWVDLFFEPHQVTPAKGHELPVPDKLNEEQQAIDLFA